MDTQNNVVVPMAFPTDQNFTTSMDTSPIENENFDAQATRKPWLKRPATAIRKFCIITLLCWPNLEQYRSMLKH